MLTADEVRKLLDYDPETGIFRWKPRTPDMFDGGNRTCAAWNTRWAGKMTGCPSDEGYLRIVIFGKCHKAHRLAWAITNGCWPESDIDHRNVEKSDNRIENLRKSTKLQNARNKRIISTNTSGFKGVSYRKDRDKWTAQIMIGGKQRHLGYFGSPELAA